MSATLQRRVQGALASSASNVQKLNAEAVTIIATNFLKRIGHKSGIRPKRVSREQDVYTIEVEMKKLSAIVRIHAETHEIKEYEIQPKGEESSFTAVSPRTIGLFLVIAVVANVVMHFAFQTLGF